MDNKNCSNVQLCQAVDSQLQIGLTEELINLYPCPEALPNQSDQPTQFSCSLHTTPSHRSVTTSEDQISSSFIVENDNFAADIELVSLTSQQSIPRYRLRVDPCTAFLGYKNRDFRSAKRITRNFPDKYLLPKSLTELTTIEYINSDSVSSHHRSIENHSEEDHSEGENEDDDTLSLTTEQIENTLDYFILCGLRVSQMTKTYEDLDAITQLLEEKQTDLELAAKIGKNLLAKNHDLQSRLLETEKNLSARDEIISQLNHNLTVKDNLLRIFLRDSDQTSDINDNQTSASSSGRVSPFHGHSFSSGAGSDIGFSISSVNFSQLHKKLEDLEEENNILRHERNRLCTTADQLDEHETALVRDCARQLIEANLHIRTLSDKLAKKSDAFMNQQSEVTRLLTRGLDLENRVKQLTAENEILSNRLKEIQASQLLLASELKTSRDKYDECLTLYNEARSEIRTLRKRSRRGYYRPGSLTSSNSIVNASMLPSLPPSYLSGSAVTPQSDPDSLYFRNHLSSSVHQVVSDGSTSSLDVLDTENHGSEHFETSLAADLAHARIKEHARDNIKHLFRAMDQVHHTRIPSGPTITSTITTTTATITNSSNDNANSHNIAFIESGLEDTVSSSGFVSGSEPSDNLRKHRIIRSEHISIPGSPCSTRPFISDVSPNHLTDAERSKSDVINYRFYRHSTEPNHLLESEKRHSWFGCDVTPISFNKRHNSPIFNRELNFQNSFDDSMILGDPNVICTDRSYFKLPQRLKLIKPLDGSNVLQHWQQLATPSFTRALFEAPLPGVQSRAGVPNSSNTNCSASVNNTSNSRQRPLSIGSSPFVSCSSQITGSTDYLVSDLLQVSHTHSVQSNIKQSQQSLEEKCVNLNRFGLNSSTCLLTNRLRTRSLDHLAIGSPALNIDKNDIDEPIHFHQAFSHVRRDESASPSSFLSPFSLTSLVSAILPFTTVPPSSVSSSDPKGDTFSRITTPTKKSSQISESIRLRPPKSSSSTKTGLQGLLDVNEEDSDSSKSLFHRTSTSSKLIDRNTLPSNANNMPNPIALPNPQPPPIITPSVNRPVSHVRPLRTSNLTEITEESGSPPKPEKDQSPTSSSSEQQKQSQCDLQKKSETS
ncbi:Trafficking kinesin-binding protein isoform 1 [Schistosoma japonicum]|uniref:Trafficking kinesin-binding protein isoform 1 n=2 Tax=Schistosoma japonicum TaxID=6182 RepID=A0A4Z2D5T4_SCHJA|nr:Trafficking kinesin-binding protein isoform 1 [Schistosoma japonicum]